MLSAIGFADVGAASNHGQAGSMMGGKSGPMRLQCP